MADPRTVDTRRLRARARGPAIGVAVLVVVGVVLFAFGGGGSSGGVAYAGDLRPGGTLEELRLPALEGDGTFDYASFADRPVVINFFASWCPACVAEMPAFEHVHQRLGDRVVFLGIAQSDAPDASIELVRQTGITYATGLDPRGAFFNAIGGLGMPTTVLVHPGGEIAEVWVGALDEGSLEDLIAEHFG